MRLILRYIREYFYEVDKRVLWITTALTAVLIFFNYTVKLNTRITRLSEDGWKAIAWFVIFLVAFGGAYCILFLVKRNLPRFSLENAFLVFLAPALFAFKMVADVPFDFSTVPVWDHYWKQVVYWPLLAILFLALLYIIWKFQREPGTFYGLTRSNFRAKPYLLMLLIMIPLIVAASTQSDFLSMYPKLKMIRGLQQEATYSGWHRFLFELSYGTDFLTIELFFRGWLVLGFVRWAGRDAILPMACFYCTIHFGKPLGECISSYFGGILLGIVVYNTRTILGGLLVHLGIAWLMEAGGAMGIIFFSKDA